MDIPIAIHVDRNGVSSVPAGKAHIAMQARSLRNTLGVLKRRLRMMKEKEIHTMSDLEHYKYVLDHLEERWRDDEGLFAGELATTEPALADACSALWTECYDLVADMEEEALDMSPEVREIHLHLVDLRRRLQELAEREHSSAEVVEVTKELDKIDAARRENGGVFFGDVEAPAPGQNVCAELLSQNYALAREAASTAHDEPAELRAAADALRALKNDLRSLAGHRHHTSADVSHFRFLLMAIASAEAEYANEWRGSEAERLVKECSDLVEKLETTSEPMPPEVERVYIRLIALKRELSTEAAKAGRPDEAKLRQWWADVDEIDNERAAEGGVFGGGEGGLEAPPGQAVCQYLLDQCYAFLQELLAKGVEDVDESKE